MHEHVRDGALAGLAAGAVSGLPSTLHALATGRDWLEATRAAGSIALPPVRDERALLCAGVVVHAAVSAFWGVVLARALPASRPREAVLLGSVAGGAIAGLDLGLLGRAFPRLRALPALPQLADHVAYGAAAGFVLARRRTR